MDERPRKSSAPPDVASTVESLAAQTIRGSAYGVGSSAVTLSLGFVRAVLLARLLLPEHFGLMALALFYNDFAGQLRALGTGQAMIHHPDPDERTVRTFFLLRMGLTVLTSALLAAAIPLLIYFYPTMHGLGWVVLSLAGLEVVRVAGASQEVLLTRAMAFRSLAIADVLASIAMTCCAPLVAWRGGGVWALVAELLSGILVRTGYVWWMYPEVRPCFGWDRPAARWFWKYGRPSLAAVNIGFVLQGFDDFWIGTSLGKVSLGFYSRAYEFAGYPRRVVANPVLDVFFSTFARLQHDRLRLSRAYFRVTTLIVRCNFWFSSVFILAAPEFVRLFLGERWLPMTLTFQLLVIYMLLDPLAAVATNLLLATGHPSQVTSTRVVQLVIFIPAVILFGHLGGIAGVALAADIMLATGALLLFRVTRRFVDYSLRLLYLWPLLSLFATAGLVLCLQPVWSALPPWGAFVGKALCISVCYTGILWLMEREQLRLGWDVLREHGARALPAGRLTQLLGRRAGLGGTGDATDADRSDGDPL